MGQGRLFLSFLFLTLSTVLVYTFLIFSADTMYRVKVSGHIEKHSGYPAWQVPGEERLLRELV